jgi:hypothetical protein
MCSAQAVWPQEAAGRAASRRLLSRPVCRDRSQGRLQVNWLAGLRALLLAPAPGYFRMLTARATIRATVTMDTADCKVMASLAQRDSGITSVGLNAAALVKAR